MNSQLREIAKFACGFESFHALFHGYLWTSKTTITVVGLTLSPALNAAATIISGAIAVGLGAYAWRRPKEDSP
jgi:hypothetical protein